ncbi:sensor histidine kinase [Paenibacillaceae bacterium WGS1546]|uniref:sensor histidine kinase n=1 Tax=Cohnella sp. WGS1546 TaxID=3366810 RepID=UPI00372D65FF
MGQIDQSLNEVDKYLYGLAVQNTDLLILDLPEQANSDSYYSAKIRLSNTISSDIYNYRNIDLFFIYSSVNQDLFTTVIPGAYEEQQAIQTNIRNMFKDTRNDNSEKWLVRQIGNKFYLAHYIRMGDVFVGAWVRTAKLMIPMNLVDLGPEGKAMLVDDNQVPLTNSGVVEEQKINLNYKGNLFIRSGAQNKFLVVGAKSSKGSFGLNAIISEKVILEKLPSLGRVVTLISVTCLFVILLFLIFLRRTILLPVSRIVDAMRKIKNGHWETRITQPSTSREFELINETFNNMASQVQELKINIYEEKLQKKNAELNHLKLQINPHFFLNSLNIIFQLAQIRDFSMIQKMTHCLVNHFRFMFQSDLMFVRIEDEVKHTRNYLRIQNMRFSDYLTYDIEVPEGLNGTRIPPLLIQTFVENSIKHAVTLDEPLHIEIKAEMVEHSANEHTIRIVIRDTGPGFSEQMLQELSFTGFPSSISNERIGIHNTRRRLDILYDGHAGIVFRNHPEGGAVVDIHIAVVSEEKGAGKYALAYR